MIISLALMSLSAVLFRRAGGIFNAPQFEPPAPAQKTRNPRVTITDITTSPTDANADELDPRSFGGAFKRRFNPATLKPSKEILDRIKLFEGLRLNAYQDTGRVWTIGYGHAGPDVFAGLRWTKERADNALIEDAADAAGDVRRLVKVDLTQGEFDALVSFVFNLGAANFARSTLLKLLNKGDYDSAGDQLSRWVFDDGVKLAGLETRRAAERAFFFG